MPRERGAIRLTQENYRVNSIWYDRERERGAQCRACSLILFSIHPPQRLEAPEGSPARSLDALPRTLRQRNRTGGPLCSSLRRSGESQYHHPREKTLRWVVIWFEWVDWWVGLRQSGRLGTLPVYLPAAARGSNVWSVTPAHVISLLLF